jgi:ZIP family zinc transporter
MLESWLWGTVAGSALLVGAAIGYFARLPQRLIAAVMSFGAGVLISALAFDLMAEAYDRGGAWAISIGFLTGAAMFTLANVWLARRGAKHRKRSGHGASQPSDQGSGIAIAVGALIDGIPESVAIGVSLLQGGAVSTATVAAIFLSNLPEGLSSSAGMRKAGRSAAYVFGVWTTIAVVSGLAALAGFAVGQHLSAPVIATITAVAAGAVLTMLTDTMIPEAFETAHDLTGLITVMGFLLAFVIGHTVGH